MPLIPLGIRHEEWNHAEAGAPLIRVTRRPCRRLVHRASSEDRNLTGLALVRLREGAGRTEESKMMLPGDCPFDRVPSIPSASSEIGTLLTCHRCSNSHSRMPGTGDVIDDRATEAVMVHSSGDPIPYRCPGRNDYPPDSDASAETARDLRDASNRDVDVGW